MYPWAREDAPRCTEARRLMVTHFERAAYRSFPWTREIPHMFYKKPGHIWGISLKNNIVRIVYRLERSIRSKRAGVRAGGRWGVLFCGCAPDALIEQTQDLRSSTPGRCEERVARHEVARMPAGRRRGGGRSWL